MTHHGVSGRIFPPKSGVLCICVCELLSVDNFSEYAFGANVDFLVKVALSFECLLHVRHC